MECASCSVSVNPESNMERASNGNWFNRNNFHFYADDGFGNLVRVSSWPAMNHSSEEYED